jgi:hypothetical protein
MLLSIQNLIPSPLRTVVLAGPVDGTSWCLIVEGSAAVAKLRQLLPKFQAQLLSRGKHITDIRLKVKSTHKH